MKLKLDVNSIEETERLANILASVIKPGATLFLTGDLGAGKTTFSQFLGKALGVTKTMTSPTFTIIKTYQADGFNVHHMDCYRLEHSEEDLGFDEYFNGRDVVIAEWPQYIEDFWPDDYLILNIEYLNETTRMFSFESHGNTSKHLLEAFHEHVIN